ncbi:hypothetical protein [Cohnella sp.]|uniref:hypothetical protein n=1 Tax=Cohnella sp. TaxID=1883426 RepID=UPI00356141B5
MQGFSYEDMQRIDRAELGDQVPLKLFRTIRLIGMCIRGCRWAEVGKAKSLG